MTAFLTIWCLCHDIVNFVKSFVIWTTPGPSPLVLLFEERVHDLKVVGNDKVDKAPFLDLFYHHDRRRLDIIIISASNYCVKVALQ